MKLHVILLVLVVHLLTGCSRESADRDVLRVGVAALPASWGDPYRAEGGPPAHTWSALFDGLTRIDGTGEVRPALAERWTTTDGRRWEFTLRKGVRFSSGAPLDAEAVAATFRWLRTPVGRSTLIGARMKDIVQISVAGPDTLILDLGSPDPVMPRRLSAVAIVDAEAWSRLGPSNFSKQPVGTGPYRLVRFDERGRRAIMEANPFAWRAPRTRRLEIVELVDEAVRNQALISGHIDLSRVGIDEIDLLEKRGIRVTTPPAMQVMAIALITEGRDTPLDDVRVRRALNHAVDKVAIARMLFDGKVVPSGQPASRVTQGFNPAVRPYPYDPARARGLLASAGYARGFDMTIEGVVGALPADTAVYQAVTWYLGEVGIRATFRAASYATMVRRNQTGQWDGVDAYAGHWSAGPYNDLQRPLEAYSCLKPRPHFCDRHLSNQLRVVQTEMDPERRQAGLLALSQAFHEQAATIFLIEQVDVFGHSPRIRNLQIANRVPVYEGIELRD